MSEEHSVPRPETALLTRSYARGATDVPLIEQPIGAFFDAIAAHQPNHEALVSVHQRRRYTYLELQRETNRLASALLGLGLQPGERVGIWSHNNAEWVLMQLATAKAGLILVNINPAYRTAEVEYALNKVDCKALVTMARFKTSDYLGMLRELAPEWEHGQPGQLESAKLPHLRSVVWIDEAGQGAKEDQPGLTRFSSLLASGNPDDPRLAALAFTLQATDPINIQFTSGTTGFPKGATLTHRNILNNGFFIGEAMKLTPADRLCIPVPLYHCFGMVLGNLACLTHGATIVYPNDGFEPLSVLQTVQDERCTGLHGVPTMFIAELDHPRFAEFDLSTLRTGIMAGSPCPTEVMKRVVSSMNLGQITIAYGMTETSPVSCQSSIDTPLGQARLDRRPGAAAPGDQDHRPRERRDRRARRVGRILHARLFGHARLLGRPGAHGGIDRRRRLDAHRRPGDHGRRGLRQHRRPHQGHGDSRRREHLPARDRGIPLPPPEGAGRAGRRPARQALRRGTLRLDRHAPRRNA